MTQHSMEDTIHVLQNRILQDKHQLKHLQSLLYPSSTVQEAPEKAYRHRHHHMETTGYGEPQDPTSESIHVRSNPIFQSNFDAMDTYDEECMRRIKQRRTINQPSHAAAGRHHAMQHLFHQCRKRIGRAEKLLDRACSEKSIRLEIASLRQCIELCLDEMKHRQAADERLTRILQDHVQDVVLESGATS